MEFLLKQRLVGAIVLVALGVIFIPMLLEGPNRNMVPEMEALPDPGRQQASQTLDTFPAPGEVPSEPVESVVLTEKGSEIEPESEQEAAKPEPAEPEPEPAPEPSKTVAAPAPLPAPPEPEEKTVQPGPLGNWVVQAGSFSSEANALRLRDKLRALKVYQAA